MRGYDMTTYGQTWADHYDEVFPTVDQATVSLLAGLAGTPGKALELAIGTGRIAIPLSAMGVEVTGIDVSEEMVAKLRAKPGGEAIEVIVGDFADVGVDQTFPLVYLAFNTLFALTDQNRQVECFRNVALVLEAGGRFVIDAFVPDLGRFHHGQHVGVSSISGPGSHALEFSLHDPVNQRIDSHMVRRGEDGTEVVLPVSIRYCWPSELDLMARMTGLTLENRWAWYDRSPFTEDSRQHVSIYRKPPA